MFNVSLQKIQKFPVQIAFYKTWPEFKKCLKKGQGEPTPSLPCGKNPEIGNLSIFRFWLQIWFQKYHIRPYDTQFLINKHKIGADFNLHSLRWGQWGGQSSPSLKNWFRPLGVKLYNIINSMKLGIVNFQNLCLRR
jgi:hypothetical protein